MSSPPLDEFIQSEVTRVSTTELHRTAFYGVQREQGASWTDWEGWAWAADFGDPIAEHNATVEWQWTKQSATLAFKNPKKDCLFYLDVDHPPNVFPEPQQVQVSTNGPVWS